MKVYCPQVSPAPAHPLLLPVPVIQAPPASQTQPEALIVDLAVSFQRLLLFSFPWIAALLVLLAFGLLLISPERLPVYLAAAGPAVLMVNLYAKRQPSGLPIFPLYVALQALAFCAPLLAPRINADWRVEVTSELLSRCVLPLLLWFAALWIGWKLTPATWGTRRPAPALSQALANPSNLPHWVLAIALALQLFISSSLLWQLPNSIAVGLLNPIQTLIGLASIIGAFTGAYAWARGCLPFLLPWILLLVTSAGIALTSLLLSSLQSIFIAFLLGIWLGKSRQALPITLAALLLLGLLQTGKWEIRRLYWGEGAAPIPTNPIELVQEWFEISLDSLANPGSDEPSNLFTDRFNNIQNLLYVEQELASGTPTLQGESLSLIPQVLLPRILNPEKVRSQEGQVLLNLHFGRQSNREDTEKAYIAWGLLAEGVGNFGSLAGPLVMGIVNGALVRISENLGRRQAILSAPGLLSLALMFLWLGSYEMVATTLLAAAMQLILVVLLLGWWFGRLGAARRPLPR